jgi:hypothetical protein
VTTAILRPVNTLGYYVHSAIGRYLRQGYVPTILGFNPMMQFIHEEDVAEAVALALQKGVHGVYNVAGPGAVPLKVAIQETGGTAIPLPEAIIRPRSRASSASGCTTRRPARWTSSSIPARSTAARSRATPASRRSSPSRTRSPVSAVEPRGFAPLGRAGDAVAETARDWLPQPIWDLRREIDERMARIPTRLNSYGYDAWGFHPATAARAMFTMALLYRYWFRVQVHGIERIPAGRVLLISNHAGQIALDAAMIGISTFLDNEPPRIVRGMGEYWLPTVPWVSELMVRSGSVVGTRKNCIDLLANEEAVIAFPEGVRG